MHRPRALERRGEGGRRRERRKEGRKIPIATASSTLAFKSIAIIPSFVSQINGADVGTRTRTRKNSIKMSLKL